MMKYSISWVFFVSCVYISLLLSFRTVGGTEAFREDPTDIFTTPGSTVVLRCALADLRAGYTVYWYRHSPSNAYLTKANQVFHQQRTGSLWRRLAVIGDSSMGEFFLEIREVESEDAGEYSCVFFQSDAYKGESAVATLTVYVPPDEGFPKCAMEPSDMYLVPGQKVVLTCVSAGGNPKPRLDWMSWHEILPGTVEQEPFPKATYELQLMESDNGAVFTCIEDTPATPQLRTCSLRPFHQPTNVSLATSPVNLGEDATFRCAAVGIPAITNYTWTVAGLPWNEYISASGESHVVKEDDQTLRIHNVHHTDNGSVVKCHANNEINEEGSASSQVLVVELLPKPKVVGHQAKNEDDKGGTRAQIGVIIGSLLGGLILVMILILLVWRLRKRKMQSPRRQDVKTLEAAESQPLKNEHPLMESPVALGDGDSPRPVTICLTPRDAIVEHIRETEEAGGQPVRPTDDTNHRVTVVGRLSCAGMTHDFGDFSEMYSRPVKKTDSKPVDVVPQNEPADLVSQDEPANDEPKVSKPKPALKPKPKVLPKPQRFSTAKLPTKPQKVDKPVKPQILDKPPKSPSAGEHNSTAEDDSDDQGENIYENTYRRPDITMDLGEETDLFKSDFWAESKLQAL